MKKIIDPMMEMYNHIINEDNLVISDGKETNTITVTTEVGNFTTDTFLTIAKDGDYSKIVINGMDKYEIMKAIRVLLDIIDEHEDELQ